MTKQSTSKIKKFLATLLTIVAVFAGQQAFATITDFMSIRGQSANINGQYYYVWSISGFMGQFSQPMTQGNSYTFNGQNIGLNRGDVHITGMLNFAESNELTDVTTGSQVTIVFYSDQFWFYDATVKKLDGTNVTGCSASASSDHTSITVTIPSGKTFGNIYLDFVAYEPFYNYNTTISGVESTYIYTGRPIEPVPTVTYNGRTLTAGTDYTVSYANTTDVGTATVTVTGTGEYAGTVTRNYNIRAVALTDFTSLGNNTYAIATTADLDHLAGYVKLDNDCQGLTFKQTADIAYTYTTAWNSSTGGETNFTAIGGWGKPFKGTFDGQNHSISGIRISKNGHTDSDKCQGLFGYVGPGGTVRNVVLADTRIKGYDGTGGIVGVNSGTIEDCRVQNNVLVRSSGKPYAGNHGSDFGGIAGSNENGGTVTRCTSSVTIDGYVGTGGTTINPQPIYSVCLGAIVGQNRGTVSNCLALNANVTGDSFAAAIVGRNNSGYEMTANYYRGCTVTNRNHSNGSSTSVGVGTSGGSHDDDGARSVHALTLGTDITATGESVEIDGTTYYASNTTVTLGYSGTVPAGQMPVYSVNGNAIEGNTFTMPTANRTVSVTMVNAWSGSGTQGSPYVITTTAQLDLLAKMVDGLDGYTPSPFSNTYFVLGNDIEYSTTGLGDTDENFIPIGGYFNGSDRNFSGTFNGQNHTISGIRLYKNGTGNADKNLGLFGRIDGATIENVILSDARITGYRFVGGLVGNKVSGTVQNCLVLESTITCADKYVGALFGKNTGTIAANYYHNCTVNGTNNATNVGAGGNGGVSASSDTDGARSVHTLTLQNGDITATGSTVAYQGTTWYASTTTVTLGYNNLLEGCVATYSLDGNILTGNTFTMPAADATVNGTFVSHWHADADHDGTTEERAYIITTTAGLDLLAKKVNGTDGYTANSFSGKYFLQAANLTYDGTANNYTPIGDNDHIFKGHYNGGGYAISGINVNTTGDRVGLFGHVGNQGSVENVTLANSTIRGNTQVGGIVGGLEYNGTLSNCRVGNDVTIGARSNNAFNHGGIVGICHISTIEGCTSAATITDDGSYYSRHYGGIVGFCQGNSIVKDCLYTGSTIIATGDKGAITGGWGTNGVVTLTNNYYTNADINFGGVNGNDVDGARRGYTITLQNENIAFIGTQTTYNASGLTAIGESVLCYNDGTTTTYYSGEGQTVTLDYTGSISSGERLIYSVNGTAIEGNTFTMPAANVTVTVALVPDWPAVPVQSIVVNPDEIYPTVGATYSIVFTVLPADATNPAVTFSTDDETIATVDENGTVTAVAAGTATITIAATDDSGVTGTLTVNVMNIDVEEITASDITVVNGQTATISYTVIPDNATDASVTFTSANTAIASVDANGVVTGVGMGVTTITIASVQNPDVTDTVEVTVNLDPNGTQFTKGINGYGNDENPGGWYLIASPLAANVAPTAVTNMTNETFDLYYFDQTGGSNGKEWKNWKSQEDDNDHFHFDLEPGIGYLYANSDNVTITFGGTPYNGNGQVTLTKTSGAEFEGWNLVGNPFTVNAYILDGRSFYIMNDQGSEIIAASEVDRDYIEPMEGIFVEAASNNEIITFTTTMPTNSPSPALVINVNQTVTNRGGGPSTGSGTAVIDRAIVRFDEGRQLPKLQIFENSPKLYIPQGGKDYAIACAGRDGVHTVSTMPINFKATKNGEYTITVNPENVEMGYLHLIDNMTGADVDLLGGDAKHCVSTYTFNAKTTDYESRFKLVYSVCGDANGDNETFAFIHNGNIIVNGEGTLQVVDVMGRVIHSGDAKHCVSTNGMTVGVYVLRLIDGNDVRTQKMVIE